MSAPLHLPDGRPPPAHWKGEPCACESCTPAWEKLAAARVAQALGHGTCVCGHMESSHATHGILLCLVRLCECQDLRFKDEP